MLRTCKGARLPKRRLLLAVAGLAASAVALSLTTTSGTLARLSAARTSGSNSFTAAKISAPAGFTATATGGTTATLSWTAPPTLTGYTLSQSPGTLAGCSAAPSAGTTSCTATSLSPKTSYTWTLTAVDHNWTSAPATTSGTTFAVVGASVLKTAPDTTSGSQSTTLSGVTTANGADLLILAYRQGSTGNIAISSVSGSAISGTPAAVNAQTFNSGGNKYGVLAWRATGSGTSNGTVMVTFSAANNTTTVIDVIQLSGDNTASPIANSQPSTGSGTTATGATLTGASPANGEVFFAGLSAPATTMTKPSGYTALDAPAPGVHGSWFSSAASSSGITTNLGASNAWGTIEIEINHG